MSPHTITSIQAGSAAAQNSNIFVGETIIHVDTAPTSTMNHAELDRALLGLEYTPISLGISDPTEVWQTLFVMRSSSKNSQTSWDPALKPFRDRRQALENASNLTKDEETELVSLLMVEASFVKLWPELRAYGFTNPYTEFHHRPNQVLLSNIRLLLYC